MRLSPVVRAAMAAVVVSAFVPAAFAQGAKKAPDPNKVFSRKDADGDGKITLDEFKAGMKEPQAEKAGKRFSKLDTNRDGTLSREEFTLGMKEAAEKRKNKSS